jgi:hypothetical protein
MWSVEMSAFYIMRFTGQAGVSGGTLYIGKGVVVGTDVHGGKYQGEYVEANGRMRGSVRMTVPAGGVSRSLVTGQRAPGGATFDLDFDFPVDTFANGAPQHMRGVGSNLVQIILEKIIDLPA